MAVGNTRILSEADRRRIEEAVKEVERRTDGEVVPVVVARSDRYGSTRWMGATFGVLSGLAFLTAWEEGVHLFWAPIGLPGAALAGFLLGGWSPLLRLLVGSEGLDRRVELRAVQAFFELDLSATAHRTGVLIFFSLLERRIEVIADRGIHEKVGVEAWERAVERAVADLRQGKGLAQAVIDAVTACGEVLAQHFPRTSDADEIPNRVLILDE